MSRSRCAIRALVVLAAATLALGTAPRTAQTAVFGLELSGGYASYSMSAFNDTLKATNALLGTDFPEIKGGATGGLFLRVWPSDVLLLRFGFEAMLAESESQGVTFDIGPAAFIASGTYYFPSTSPVRFGLGGGVGLYDVAGSLKGPGGSFDVTGTAGGVFGQGEAMWTIAPRWSLTGIAGYRYAKVSDLKVQDNSTDTEADFSGLQIRVGIGYDWKPKTK